MEAQKPEIQQDDILALFLLPIFAFTLYFTLIIVQVNATPVTAMTSGTMQAAPSLAQRNYYLDEVRLVNPCLIALRNKYGNIGSGNAPPEGWSLAMDKCSGNGTLKTIYGATIKEDVIFYTHDDNGRIDAIYKPGWEAFMVPSIAASGYSSSDANNYAYNMVAEITTAMNGQVFLKQDGNCIVLLAQEVRGPTWNAILAAHYAYPYVHVVNETTGWCFEAP